MTPVTTRTTTRTTPKYTRRKHPRGLKFGKKPHQTKPNSCNPPPYINPTTPPQPLPDSNPALPLQKKISDPIFFSDLQAYIDKVFQDQHFLNAQKTLLSKDFFQTQNFFCAQNLF